MIASVSETFKLSASAEGEVLRLEPAALLPASPQVFSRPVELPVSRERRKAEIEAILRETRGRVAGPHGAATRLGMPASTLESRIRALKINKRLFRGTA